jgi:hypothetical protein
VLHCVAVVVKMCNTFANEDYIDVHFVYGFCDGNGAAAMAKKRQQYPFAESHISKHLRTYIEFGGRLVPSH